MAIKDIDRKPYINDNKTDVFIGLDLPIHKSNGPEGFFASTSTTMRRRANRPSPGASARACLPPPAGARRSHLL